MSCSFDGAGVTPKDDANVVSPDTGPPADIRLDRPPGAELSVGLCGNGLREANEDCDGDDLGGVDCSMLGHDYGTLACNADCSYDPAACRRLPSDWLAVDWRRRKKLIVDHQKVSQDLQSFPLLVSIGGSDIASHMQSGASDLRFTADDGKTLLPHEVERYDSARGELVAWISLPALSSSQSTTLYLYFDNPKAQAPPPATVFDAHYVAVWHLAEATGAQGTVHVDASGKGHLAVQQGNTGAAGKIGGGQRFDGKDDYLTVPQGGAIKLGDNDCTVSAWVRTTSDKAMGLLIKAPWPNHETGDKLVGVNKKKKRFGVDHGWVGYLDAAPDITDDAWHHVAWVQRKDDKNDEEQWQLFVDGKLEESGHQRTHPDPTNHTLRLGAGLSGSYFDRAFEGMLDEVRISSSARSAAWIATSFANQSDPNGFIIVSNTQTLP